MRDSHNKRQRQSGASPEDLFRHVFETATNATVRIGRDGTILTVNRQFESLFDCSRDEIEGKKRISEFLPHPVPLLADSPEQSEKAGAGPEGNSFRCQLVDGTGNIREMRASVVSIPGTERRIVSFLDITEYTRVQLGLSVKARPNSN